MASFPERYIGDGVYASCDGYHIWLRTERDGQTHRIALEPEVMGALAAYEREIIEIARVARGGK